MYYYVILYLTLNGNNVITHWRKKINQSKIILKMKTTIKKCKKLFLFNLNKVIGNVEIFKITIKSI